MSDEKREISVNAEPIPVVPYYLPEQDNDVNLADLIRQLIRSWKIFAGLPF